MSIDIWDDDGGSIVDLEVTEGPTERPWRARHRRVSHCDRGASVVHESGRRWLPTGRKDDDPGTDVYGWGISSRCVGRY